jgi:hypothetical protein
MKNEQGVVVICRYVVKAGREPEMERLLAAHWPALHRAGLVTDQPAQVYRQLPSKRTRQPAPPTYVEIFAWRDERGSELAHQTPEIQAIWEPMGAICAEMQFPHFERLVLAPT